MNKKLYLLLFALILSSCTTIHFRSQGQVPIMVGATSGHPKMRKTIGMKEFFLWGHLPKLHYVKVDEEVKNMGFVSGANASVKTYQTWGDLFFSVVSLGIYIPYHYEVEAYGLESEYQK